MAQSTKALLMGRIQMCKTNPSIAHIGLATHGRSIQIGSNNSGSLWAGRLTQQHACLAETIAQRVQCAAPSLGHGIAASTRRQPGAGRQVGQVAAVASWASAFSGLPPLMGLLD